MELSEFKEKYKSLKAQSDEAWKAAEPEREKYELALEPFHEANEQIEMLMDEHGVNLVSTCEGCSIPIFEGDKSTPPFRLGRSSRRNSSWNPSPYRKRRVSHRR